LSKYSYLFKRKLSLFYSKFDNKYLFTQKARKHKSIEKAKIKLPRIEFLMKKKLLYLRNSLLKLKKRFYAAVSQKRKITRSKRKYFIRKMRKKYFKATGEPFPLLIIHYNKISDALEDKQEPNFNTKYALRNYYLLHISDIYNHKFPEKLQFKAKKLFFKSKSFKKTELTFLKKQLDYYIPTLPKLSNKFQRKFQKKKPFRF